MRQSGSPAPSSWVLDPVLEQKAISENRTSSPESGGLLLAVTDPVRPDRASDYHAWYNEVQIPPFLRMPEISSVHRFRTSSAQLDRPVPVPHEYLALYYIAAQDMDELSAFADQQFAAYQRGDVGNRSRGSDAYDQTTSRAIYYAQVGPRVARAGSWPRSILMVYTEPATDELEDEFNRWYSEEHLPDVVSVPGFTAATRYRLTDLNVGRQFKPWIVPRRYLAIYELEVEGPEAVAEAGRALRGRPNPTRSPALGSGERRSLTQFYERIFAPFLPAEG
jgi:hypothetical protein